MESWNNVLELVTAAYCRWKYPESSCPTEPEIPSTPTPDVTQDETADIEEGPQYIPYTFSLYDLFSLQREVTIIRPAHSTHSIVDLADNGYLGKTAINPTVAVSFKTLELFHRIRQRQPSLSTKAFTKVICDYYSVCTCFVTSFLYLLNFLQVPYRHYMQNVLADTFEVYLRIRRSVRKQVFTTLGWTGSDWRALNACRACCYKVRILVIFHFSHNLLMLFFSQLINR